MEEDTKDLQLAAMSGYLHVSPSKFDLGGFFYEKIMAKFNDCSAFRSDGIPFDVHRNSNHSNRSLHDVGFFWNSNFTSIFDFWTQRWLRCTAH